MHVENNQRSLCHFKGIVPQDFRELHMIQKLGSRMHEYMQYCITSAWLFFVFKVKLVLKSFQIDAFL